MRYETIKAKGLGVFRDEVSLDLASLPGTVVALCGGNGQGKSTLLELLFAASERECPTRGSLIDLAHDRQAYLEVKLTNGATHTIRHVLDAVSKKSEALILDVDGAPVLPTTSVKAFDEWTRSHLPPREVVLSSMFSAQQHGGFCDLSARERKQTLARLLGIEELEAIAERARRRASETREAHAGILGELRALPELDAASIATTLAAARADLATADRELVAARAEIESALVYRGKSAYLIAAHNELADLQARVANNRKVLEDAPKIRAAVARSAEIDAAIAELRKANEVDAVRGAELDKSARAARMRAHDTAGAIQLMRAKADRARERLKLRAEIEDAKVRLQDTRHRIERLENEEATLAAEQSVAFNFMLRVADQRLATLRGGLERVADSGSLDEAVSGARSALVTDDELVVEMRVGPTRVAEHRDRRDRIGSDLSKARTEASRLERVVARVGEVSAAERELEEAESMIADALVDEEKDASKAVDLDRKLDECRAAGRDREAQIDELERQCSSILPLVSRAGPLAVAETRLADLVPQAEQLRARIATADIELAALPEPKDVDTFAAERTAAQARATVERLDGELSRAEETAQRRADLEAQQTSVESDLADWVLLAEDLPAVGALLIDAAGPELTVLVNDLLHTCVSTRWTVSIETTRPSADGRKQIETCEVRVIDTVAGREAEVSTFSGGERALLSESVSLALTMLACRKSGVVGATLIRDESGAALDPANGRAYVAMLRKAAEIVGASRVLFVAHDVALQELADARIVVNEGRVSVS